MKKNANIFEAVEKTIINEPFFGEHKKVFRYKFVSEVDSAVILMEFYGFSKFIAYLKSS